MAHFEHGIRDDSMADARFVAELAGNYGLKFELGIANLGKDVNEADARTARWNFLKDLQKQHDAAVATGHHLDDIPETQSSGLRGLGPGAPSGVKVVDLHMRQVQRNGHVAQAAVHTNHTGAGGQRISERIQWQAGPHLGMPHALCDGQCHIFLLRAAMRQGHAITGGVELIDELLPMANRPLLVSPRRAMHQRHNAQQARFKCCVFNS